MKELLTLFLTFFRIGGFTFGGGYAMLPLIEQELVDRKAWIDREGFLDLFAMAQSMPGIFAVNISIFIGYRLRGVLGAVFCCLGTILPSFVVILGIAIFFVEFRDNQIISRIFMGIRPVVVAMIAAPVLRTWQAMKMKRSALWIPIVSAVSVWYFEVSPVFVILLSALGGLFYTFVIKRALQRRAENHS
ncbi:chromate transporter, chromate ion transporter (CHR) family [Porphyromonas crevioricanis]|uniref:Chromate transporter, chromate ion transporter (CHR) family n=1 Tax=Porphyromonas crevioricanis TaxID=393921 RepID=A0A2X4PHC6_9PORP|nr:chromate transporter [Porphyromonas crevioricanis]GAD06702.1 chromate transport protein [Porphyromonas crevioricanis JCM 13913]SQH73326.1 chromate transporter, chromate ion transporter (CHR) family [Porphyromonas crevioricanis]